MAAPAAHELPSSSISAGTAALARLSPPELPGAAQQLLQQCVAFMQEQSSIGSEALVSLLQQHKGGMSFTHVALVYCHPYA